MSSSHVLRFSLLAVVLMALVLSGSASRIQQCRTRCSQMRQDAGVAQRRETLCRPYEGRLPRPIVYHACLQAFDAALQPACEVTCEYPELTCDNNIVSEPALKSALESRCTGMRSRRPTPLMYNVCEAGFRGGARAVCSVVAAQEKATAAKAQRMQEQEAEARLMADLHAQQQRGAAASEEQLRELRNLEAVEQGHLAALRRAADAAAAAAAAAVGASEDVADEEEMEEDA